MFIFLSFIAYTSYGDVDEKQIYGTRHDSHENVKDSHQLVLPNSHIFSSSTRNSRGFLVWCGILECCTVGSGFAELRPTVFSVAGCGGPYADSRSLSADQRVCSVVVHSFRILSLVQFCLVD